MSTVLNPFKMDNPFSIQKEIIKKNISDFKLTNSLQDEYKKISNIESTNQKSKDNVLNKSLGNDFSFKFDLIA